MPSNRRGKAKLSCYGAWADMLQRCYNPNLKYFPRYGGRGIIVCDRWRLFDNFYYDMGNKPKGYSIGRIDNDGHYKPENCRWETNEQQNFNKCSNRLVEFNGITQSITEWARGVGINRGTLATRLNRGWNVSEAMSIPAFPKGGHR